MGAAGSAGEHADRVEPTVLLERSGLTDAPIEVVIESWWPRFRARFPRVRVPAAGFETFFSDLLKDTSLPKEVTLPAAGATSSTSRGAALRTAFHSMDLTERGVLDGFQLFAALAMLARGPLEAKVNFLFHLFDVAGQGSLNHAALSLLLDRTCAGLQSTCTCLDLLVPSGLPEAVADRAFQGKPPSHEMSFADFAKWWQHHSLIRRGLERFVAGPDEEVRLPCESDWREESFPELEAEWERMSTVTIPEPKSAPSGASGADDAEACSDHLVSAAVVANLQQKVRATLQERLLNGELENILKAVAMEAQAALA